MDRQITRLILGLFCGALASCGGPEADFANTRETGAAVEDGGEGEDSFKIVGGTTITPGVANSTPVLDAIATSTVLIIGGGTQASSQYICTGTVVNSAWLLTAAHCLYDSQGGLLAVIDLYFGNYPTNRVFSTSLVRRVTTKVRHPSYVHSALAASYDIALLQFAGGLPTGFKAATFHQESSADALMLKRLFVGGYGITLPTASDQGKLRYAEQLGFELNPDTPETEIPWAGVNTYSIFHDGIQDTCSGDSGGPNYFVSSTGQVLNSAITSRGHPLLPCAVVSINVIVSRYLSWMRTHAVTVQSAPFVVPKFTLSVTKSGAGTGTVTSSPSGISCGSTCSKAYNVGTTITLTPAAATGSVFASWQGCSSLSGTTCTVSSIAAAQTVIATFNIAPVAKPAKPTAFKAVGQSLSLIRLSWEHSGAKVTGFRIERSNSAAGPFTLLATTGATVRSYDHTGLPSGTTQYYRIAAINAGGLSPFVVAQGATTAYQSGSSWHNAACPTDVNLDGWADRRDYFSAVGDYRVLPSTSARANDVNNDGIFDVYDVFAIQNSITMFGERICP